MRAAVGYGSRMEYNGADDFGVTILADNSLKYSNWLEAKKK